MKLNEGFKRKLSIALYAASIMLFMFSAFILFMVHNVKKMNFSEDSENKYSSAEIIQKLKASNPDLYYIGNVKVFFPEHEKFTFSSTVENGLKFAKSKINACLKELAVHKEKIGSNAGKETGIIKFYRNIINSTVAHYAVLDLNNVDRGYTDEFWRMNEPLKNEISAAYRRPLAIVNATSENLFERMNYDFFEFDKYFFEPEEKRKYLSLLQKIAASKGDNEFRMQITYYFWRLVAAETFLCRRNGYLIESLNKWGYVVAHEGLSYGSIFLYDNGILSDEKIRRSAKDVLLKMVEFLDSKPEMTAAIDFDCERTIKKMKKMKTSDKLTCGVLNLWYGDPYQPLIDLQAKVNGGPKMGLKEIEIFMNEYWKKSRSGKRYVDVLANSGNDILSMYKFIKFSVNMHPFAARAGKIDVPDTMTFACYETYVRLVTLGGLARLYYAEYGRWPDLSKDMDFRKEAGIAAVDPYDNSDIKIETMSNGWLKMYGSISEVIEKKMASDKFIVSPVFLNVTVPMPALRK